MRDFKLLTDAELEQYPVFYDLASALAQPEMAYMIELEGAIKKDELGNALARLPRVQTLALTENAQLDAFPSALGQLKHLEYLEIRNTAVEMLPDSLASLVHLTDLVISECPRFHHLPEFLGNIKEMVYLEVTGTRVEALPESIGQLSKLEELNINSNQLHQLPDGIGQLENLVTLRTYGNHALALSAPAFKGLKSLRVFDHGVIQFQNGTLLEVQNSLPNCTFTQITRQDPIYEA